MRFIAKFLVPFAFSLSLSCQTTSADNRSLIASQWLNDLCVVSGGAYSDLSPAALSAAFDAWKVGRADPAVCPPDKSHTDSGKPPELDLSETKLYPSTRDRLLRLTEFAGEAQQTPDYVYGVLEGAPTGTPSTFLANTDHGIFSYGGPVHFNELFVGADQRVNLCTAIGALKQNTVSTDRVKDIERAHCNDEKYMATSRYRDRFMRIGSAVTLNIRFAQVPLFESGVLIASESPSRQKWSPTVTGTFDTSSLYRSQAEATALATYVTSNKDLRSAEQQDQNFDIDVICGRGAQAAMKTSSDKAAVTRHCIGKFAAGGYLQRTLLFLLPVIAVKVTSPFDLAKYGSLFQEPPNRSGHSLYDVTFTWNAQKVFPNAASIVSAIKTADTLFSLPPQPAVPPAPTLSAAEQEWRRKVKVLYMELLIAPTVASDDQWWNELRSTVLR